MAEVIEDGEIENLYHWFYRPPGRPLSEVTEQGRRILKALGLPKEKAKSPGALWARAI